MDDLVTRLRNWHDQRDSWQTLTEAADEIERLRTLLDNILKRQNKNNARQLQIVRKVEADRDRWKEIAHDTNQ